MVPASIKTVRYPGQKAQGPSFSEVFGTLANAYLMGKQQRSASQQDAVQKAFLSMASGLASQGQIKPGQSNIGGVNYPWEITAPEKKIDWANEENKAQTELLLGTRQPSAYELLKPAAQVEQDRAYNDMGYKSSGENVAETIRLMKQALLAPEEGTPATKPTFKAKKTATPELKKKAKAWLQQNMAPVTEGNIQAVIDQGMV